MARQTTSTSVPIERSLDQVVERLAAAEQSPNVRALLIEARRLKSIISNWRAIPPLPQVREEMLARVLHISAAVGEALPSPVSSGRPSMQGLPAVRSLSQTGLHAVLDEPPPSLGGSELHAGEATVITEAVSLPETPLDVHPIQLPDDVGQELVMITDPYSLRADAYRALRHRLSSSGDPRIIGVTSAVRGEGKTTAAINLAISLREGARGRVLLVEANQRYPAVAQRLGFRPPECFAAQLGRHRKDPLQPWVAVEPFAPFHIMAVDPEGSYSPILDPIAFSIAMDRLRLAGYDFIVVDTPPVLESADVNLIADSVDGMILATATRKSRTTSVKRAIDALGKVTFIGTVLLE